MQNVERRDTLRSTRFRDEAAVSNPDSVEEISQDSPEEMTKCTEPKCSKSRMNVSYASSEDEDDDDVVNPSMNQYETKLSMASNVEVVIKTEKRSLISGLYVEVPPRKKIRSAYKPDDFDEEIAYTEEECLSELLSCENMSDISEDDYIRFDLDNFVIYDNFEKEIAEIAPEKESKIIYWDGLIVDKNKEIFCKGANYSTFSISGYGSKVPDVEILIQSGVDENVWYNLLQPQLLYQRLWVSFLWKARMVKYVLDFLHEKPNSLFHDLKRNFYNWISSRRSKDRVFNEWISATKGNFDFRSVVANNIDLLWHQAHNLGKGYSDLKFFKDEFCPMWTNAVGGSNAGEKTVVTPFVYKWFDDLFPHHLMPLGAPNRDKKSDGESVCTPYLVIESDQEYQQYKIIDHSDEYYFDCCISEEEQLYEKVTIDGVTLNVGDAIEIRPDESCDDDRWLCYITELKQRGRRGVFRLVWLYTRKQTILCNLNKDFGKKNSKEVFFTTHCECDSETLMSLDSVIRKIKIYYNESDCPDYEYDEISFFCRYYYRHVQTDGAFLTFRKEMLNFKNEDLVCGCKRRGTSLFDRFTREYEVGDCILINPQEGDVTDLYTVCRIECVDPENKVLKLRRFYRFCEVSGSSPQKTPPNELLYSDYVFDFNRYRSVVRECHVEFFEFGKPLPVNLLHKGSGNHFYFSRKYDRETKSIKPIKSKGSLSASFPDYGYKVGHIDRLNGLDLFCGGGSLGRGFEDAGVVKCKWAIDKDSAALKTYRHNAQGDDIQIINESVNRVLSAAILGTSDVRVPDEDEVDIILAGSPCQGFSYMNKHRENDKSQSNNSLVASVASFVDYYRPRYILLENVARITQSEVFMRLFACLLDLGYQIRFNVVSAAHLGCVQIRNRVFMWGAAKGEVLPEMPPMTHNYSKRTMSHRELVSMGNTLRLQGFQYEKHSSFPMTTIKDLIGDLPEIDTGVYWDPAYPDHKTHYTSLKSKEILRRVPIDPPTSDYYYARKLNLIPNIHSHESYDAKMRKYPTCNYKYCQRVDGDDIFVTICTVMRCNGFYPQIVHYLEPRVISVREAARAQGFLETDILCGRVSDQYRVVGNSVPRNVAFSLGLQLCRAMTDPNHKSNPKNFPTYD